MTHRELEKSLLKSDFAVGDEFWYKNVQFEVVALNELNEPLLKITGIRGGVTGYREFKV